MSDLPTKEKMYKKILCILMLIGAAGTQSMHSLHEAIKNDSFSSVVKILHEQSNLLESLNDEEQTPLLYAANLNRKSIALHLILAGANLNASADGFTALHYALNNRNNSFAYLLIENGASLNSANPQNGATLLHFAAEHSNGEITALLCDEGADVTIKNNRGMTPLEVACNNYSMSSFEKLCIYDSNRSHNLLIFILQQKPAQFPEESFRALIAALLYHGIKVSDLDPEVCQKALALFNTASYHIIKALLSFDMGDYLYNRPSYYTWNDSANTLEFMYAQGLFDHVARIENSMMQSPRILLDSHRTILQSAVSRGDREVCAMILAKLPKAEHIKNHSFLLNLAINLKHNEIALMLLKHLLQNKALTSTLKDAVISRHSAAIEALLHAGAPTTAAEEFLNDPARDDEVKIRKAFYAALKTRFTMHREILRNPTKDLYLSLLCGDIREFILGPMVKTHYPQPLSPLTLVSALEQ